MRDSFKICHRLKFKKIKWTQLLLEIIFEDPLDSLGFTLILYLSHSFLKCTIGGKEISFYVTDFKLFILHDYCKKLRVIYH